jgi:hypothetical protein
MLIWFNNFNWFNIRRNDGRWWGQTVFTLLGTHILNEYMKKFLVQNPTIKP